MRTAIAERPHAHGGDADAVGDVPMWGEPPAREMDCKALQPIGSGAHMDRVKPAQSFKTPGIAAA